MHVGLLLVAISVVFCLPTEEKERSIHKLSLDAKQREKVEQLHYGWYIQAVSALLGAVAKEEYEKMDRNNRRSFVACLNAIEGEYDLEKGADCLVKAFDDELVSSFPSALSSPLYDFVETSESHSKRKEGKMKRKKKLKPKVPRIHFSRDMLWTRRHRKSRNRGRYRKRMKRNVLSLYTNDEMKAEAKLLDRRTSKFRVRNMQKAPALRSTKKSPVKVITNLLSDVVRSVKNETKEDQLNIKQSFKKLEELQRTVSSRNERGKFKHRMLDMVLGKDNPFRRRKTFTDRFRDMMPEKAVDSSVYGLVDSVSKHTEDVNLNMLSPRFMPLLPDKYSASRPLLSPNLFPLYKDDSDNSILPIPDVLEKSGLNREDRESILELVMDASGVNNVVDDALRTVNGIGLDGLGEDVLGITKLIDETFQELAASLNKQQKKEIKERSYSFLEKHQLSTLYGDKGIYNNTVADLPFDLDEYSNLTHGGRGNLLKDSIRHLADGENGRRRRKRTLKVTYFRHTTLAPFAFSPTYHTLVVLGPLTLSPSLFSPSIISPLLLSPPTISPQVGNPLIFSPYLLGPNVLSAAVFNAYVFSPYVLSPNVINPYVLSPLILSPFVLCPDVVSPTILSGVILSPAVLSPSIFTESALAANVLSPTFLS